MEDKLSIYTHNQKRRGRGCARDCSAPQLDRNSFHSGYFSERITGNAIAIIVFVHSFYFILLFLVIIVSSIELALISFSYSASQL